MADESNVEVLCPYCKKAITEVLCKDIPAKWQSAVVASEPPPPAKLENKLDKWKYPAKKSTTQRATQLGLFACPHCRTIIGAAGNLFAESYIGNINIKT